MKRNNVSAGRAGIAGLLLALGTWPAMAQDADALAACQLVEDSDERLACYDRILKPREAPPAAALPAETAPDPVPEPAEERGATASSRALDDEVGKESIANDESDKLAARGRLVKCQRSRSGKYVFWFENGQVWRQKGSVTPNWKDCAFEVTVSKDTFGYTMMRDDESKKIRIERVE